MRYFFIGKNSQEIQNELSIVFQKEFARLKKTFSYVFRPIFIALSCIDSSNTLVRNEGTNIILPITVLHIFFSGHVAN